MLGELGVLIEILMFVNIVGDDFLVNFIGMGIVVLSLIVNFIVFIVELIEGQDIILIVDVGNVGEVFFDFMINIQFGNIGFVFNFIIDNWGEEFFWVFMDSGNNMV